MNISEKSHSDILSAIREALSKYNEGEQNSVITDIHIQPIQESAELAIFDDDDNLLSKAEIEEWCDADDIYHDIALVLESILEKMRSEGVFDHLILMKPYSFVLVDDDKETVSELMLIDDEETLLLNEELLKGLDDELDAFLKDLLEK